MNSNNKENILLFCHSYYHRRSIIDETLRKDKNKTYPYDNYFIFKNLK